ncbi:MAG TPA: hypothetical protein VHK91_11615 [Flavisolibacter sp.]|jgi:uncharacterized short protein YbdD (DUF466 family)|nr:hypothetical protein [Flavisolibacter sp.]
MTKFYFLLLGCSIYMISCKSASKAYQKGDYADAIELGVKKLQKDPYDRETRSIVQNSYNFAVAESEGRIRALSNSTSEDRFEKIYSEYYRLQDLYNTVHAYPEPTKMISVKDYSEYVETYRNKAAEVHVARAQDWQKEGTKTAYRQAYNEYKIALRYRPDDYQLKRKTDSAYDAAITKVLFIPMQNRYGNYSYSGSYQLQNFQNDVLRTLASAMSNDFVRFYSEWDSRNKNIKPDQIMELNLGRMVIGQPYDNKSVREVSKEVVVKEIVNKQDSVIKQYGTVKAKITTVKRTLLSEGDLIISLRDTQGRLIWDDRFTGQHKWETEFATYTGDERALSESDKTVLNKGEQASPREDQITQELFRQIQNDLSYRLRNYYARY